MKGLSILLTIALFVLADQMARRLRRSGEAPRENAARAWVAVPNMAEHPVTQVAEFPAPLDSSSPYPE